MPQLDQLTPIAQFAETFAARLGLKPRSVRMMIDRNQDELVEVGAIFKTKGKSRVVNSNEFLKWYLNH